MCTQKTRVIIASILLIAGLALALRGRIIWEEITQWLTVQSLPLIISRSEPLEQPKQFPEQPLSMQRTSQIDPALQTSTMVKTSNEPQIIPTPETVETVKKPRIPRRRRRKEPVSAQQSHDGQEELRQALPIIVAEEKQPEKSTLAQAPLKSASEEQKKEVSIIDTPVAQKISVINKINVTDLSVKHWTGTYSPTKLEITLNNVPFIIVGNNPTTLETVHEIPCTDNRITVCYHYEFLNGMRKGSDTVVYTCTDLATPLEMRFSWDTPWHVELNGAQRVE